MLGVACGGLLNVKFGIRPSHYGIAIVSAMLGGVPPTGFPVHGLARTAFALALILAVANALTVLLMCGLSECPDNPTRYLWL
jgi:hypothetical protein